MAKVYDVVATTGKYEKDGQTKYRTQNVGAVIQTKEGYLKLKLTAPVVVNDEGQVVNWFSLFEPRPQQSQQQAASASQDTPLQPDFEDSQIPF